MKTVKTSFLGGDVCPCLSYRFSETKKRSSLTIPQEVAFQFQSSDSLAWCLPLAAWRHTVGSHDGPISPGPNPLKWRIRIISQHILSFNVVEKDLWRLNIVRFTKIRIVYNQPIKQMFDINWVVINNNLLHLILKLGSQYLYCKGKGPKYYTIPAEKNIGQPGLTSPKKPAPAITSWQRESQCPRSIASAFFKIRENFTIP